MTSKNIYTPYFYIIQHKETGKKYAGSRWAKNCHPDEFMKKDGYTTSSNIINNIIKQNGINVFEIIELITQDELIAKHGIQTVYQYESWFLQTNKCATSNEWYNAHNNNGVAFGTDEFIEKAKQTKLNRYGNSSYTNREKNKTTVKERYNVDNVSQIPEISRKAGESISISMSNRTKIEKDISNAIRVITTQNKYGVDNVFQSDEVKNKIKIKTKITLEERYNVDNIMKIPEIILRATAARKNTMKLKYKEFGVDHNSKVQFLSIIATRKTYSKNILSRCYPEFKQFY